MPRLYPQELPLDLRRDPRLAAELRLYDALAAQLPGDWTVVYRARWLGPVAKDGPPRDGEVDFVVAHPAWGVLLLEVKGGGIRYDAARGTWLSIDRDEVEHPIDPFGQAVRSKHALLQKVRALPGWGERWADLFHAVAFPDVARPRAGLPAEAAPEIILGADDIGHLRARLEAAFRYWRGGEARPPAHGPALVEAVVALFGRSLELRNPLSLQLQGEAAEIVRLTEDQFRVLDVLSGVRRAAVAGCAGSGKTFLAAEKARRLAAEGYRTLLTCFNRPLADFLRGRCGEVPGLEIFTFHQLCSRAAAAAGLEIPQASTPEEQGRLYAEVLPEALLRAVEGDSGLRYDAVVVDEGQDFEETWWVALEGCLADPASGILYVFHDANQALYRGRGGLPGGLVPLRLSENLRNTRAIFDLVVRHYRGDVAPRPLGPPGRPPEVLAYRDADDLRRQLRRVLNRLVGQEGVDPADVAVLTPRALERSAVRDTALDGGLALVEQPPAGPREVRLSTVHRFKGLEAPVVVLAELEAAEGPERDALLYVAFSRARSHLVVLAAPEAAATLGGT